MRIQKVSYTKGLQKFCPNVLDCLSQSENTDDLCMLGGVSKDGTFGWLARGSALEVFAMSNGQRLAAWHFGAVIKEPSTTITAVCECIYDSGPLLIVATSTVNPEGLICLYDPKNFRIIKALEVPYAVKSLEVISCYGQRHTNSILLSDHLKHFCGVLAVGTHCGHVYLVDLCLDDEVEGCNELSPNLLQHISHNVKDIVGYRYSAISRSKHLYVELGEEYHVRGYYNYCKYDGTHLKSFAADDICVSCLKFVERTGLLVVGFSFGTFQLWHLKGPVLEYSSRYEEGLAPVNSVAYQEPENDPRNYCYLWVARGPQPSDSVEDYTSGITLYQLGYEKKTLYPGFGYLFEQLKDVGPRFEHDLTSDPFNLTHGARGEGSRVISCFTVNDSSCQPLTKHNNDDSFEGGSSPDLSLCVFVWEAAASDPHTRPACFLGLFDMNRWYHAHMPETLRLYGGSCDVCPYFSMCSLDGVQQEIGLDNIMAVHINQMNISRFLSVLIPEPEQHFYPSSLTIDVTCITETGVIHATYLGIQRQILSDLQASGPSVLLEPHDLYLLCLHAGLLPRSIEAAGSSVPCVYKREALLTMALNHNMIGFLNRCASALATGELKSDKWTLKSLLEWAWKRVACTKENVDKLCVQLYDWSGIPLDKQTKHLLQQHCTALRNLSLLLNNITLQSVPVTEQGQLELDMKQNVLTLLTEHVDIVLWMCSVNLLPECSEEQITADSCFVYPVRALLDFYEKRRSELHKLHSGLKTTEVLIIDSLVEHIGQPLHNLWEKEGGTKQYPPPSLHAVVNMFLLQQVSLIDKQIIVFYLLCDLVNSAPEELQAMFHEKLLRFTQKFNIPPALSKLVHGMWLLDHKDFEDSMYYLLDPGVTKQILAWQHRCILKALLYQGQSRLALQYLKIQSPPNTTPEDVRLKLTVLLSNGLTGEAFEFQRLSRDKNNVNDLLSHMFKGCQETKTVDQLLLLPFSEDEERHLVDYLKSNADVRSQELLVLYYLQRSRYVEAIHLNHQVKQRCLNELDPVARERTKVRNCLVDGYHRLLPSVQRKLCLESGRPAAQHIKTRRVLVRPTPLSTMVNRLNRKVLTRSALLETVMDKVHELKMETQLNVDKDDVEMMETAEEQTPGPFVHTPIISRTSSRKRTIPDVEFPHLTETGKPASGLLEMLGTSSPQVTHSSFVSRVFGTPPHQEQSNLIDITKSSLAKYMPKTMALLLLDTPVVKHKKLCQNMAESATPGTPHSILKVRHQPAAFGNKTQLEKPVFKTDELSSYLRAPHNQSSVMVDSSLDKESTEKQLAEDVEINTSEDSSGALTGRTLRFDNTSLNDTADEGPNAVLLQPESRRSLHERKRSPLQTLSKLSVTKHEIGLSQNSVHLHQSAERSRSINSVIVDEKSITGLNTKPAGDFSSQSPVSKAEYSLDESGTESTPVICEAGLDVSVQESASASPSDTASLANSVQHSAHLFMDVSNDTENQEDDRADQFSKAADDSIEGAIDVDQEVVERRQSGVGETVLGKAFNVSSSLVAGDSSPRDSPLEKLVSRNIYEENKCEQVVKEVKTPHKVTKVVKETSVTKRTSIKVIDIDDVELGDELAVSAEGKPAVTEENRSTSVHSMDTVEETATESVADSISLKMATTDDEDDDHDVDDDLERPGTTPTDTTVITRELRTRHSVGQSPSVTNKQGKQRKTAARKASQKSLEVASATPPRKGSKVIKAAFDSAEADSLVLTPTRRSLRLVKSEKTQPATQQPVSKTPKHKAKSASHSSSPAKSTASSPSSVDSVPVTPSRRVRSVQKKATETASVGSEKKAPVSKTKMQHSVRRTPSRTSSRASSPALSDAGTEESFIMTLRSGHKFLSRETTPDSVKTTSTMADDRETPNYRFSVPFALSEIIEENSKANTPVPDFIFSPPLTRSRQKKSRTRSRIGTDESIKDTTASPAKKPKVSKTISKKTSKVEARDAKSIESPINFIPEPSDEELESTHSVATSAKSHYGLEKVRSLRPRRRERKMEPLKW